MSVSVPSLELIRVITDNPIKEVHAVGVEVVQLLCRYLAFIVIVIIIMVSVSGLAAKRIPLVSMDCEDDGLRCVGSSGDRVATKFFKSADKVGRTLTLTLQRPPQIVHIGNQYVPFAVYFTFFIKYIRHRKIVTSINNSPSQPTNNSKSPSSGSLLFFRELRSSPADGNEPSLTHAFIVIFRRLFPSLKEFLD